jgi:hypothetical protein
MKGGEFRRIYPPKERIFFDGGKNSKFERALILDNESPDCANVVFTNGAVETRQGVAKLNTTTVGSFVGDGLYTRRSNEGSETMVAWWNGTAYGLTGASTFTTIASAQSVFTAGVRVGAAQYQNHIFFGNGGSIPYKYNGTNFTRHGVYPPTTTATVSSQNTGVLTGDYVYKVTNVNSQSVESDVGPASTTFTAASATMRVTLPTFAASYGVNARRLYRTVAGGTAFKRVTEIADNTTTTYDDNTADGSLGTAAPTDNGVPPNYSVIIYHQNRLFCNDPANPNFVVYSDLNEPYTFASTNFIRAGDNATDIVKAFGVFDNGLVVYCENSMTVIYMPDSDDSNWKIVVSKSPYGSKSPFSILNYNNRQLFPAVQGGKFVGFAALAGTTVEPSATFLSVLTAGSELKSDRIEPEMFEIQESYLGNISGIVHKNKAYVAVTYGSGQTQNNRIYVMDFSISNLAKKQQESWVPFTGLRPAQFTVYSGNLYFQSATATGFVYRMEAGVYSDDGSAIDSYFWTKEFSGYDGETNFHKDFRYANILLENAGDYFMHVSYRVDSDSGDGTAYQVDLDPGSSLWGTMVWGRDSWGGGMDQKEYRQFLGSARGKRIQFKFSNQNTAGQRFKVHGLNFAYNLKGYR